MRGRCSGARIAQLALEQLAVGRALEALHRAHAIEPQVFRGEAAHRGGVLERNTHPERLDLLDTHCQMAKEQGVLVSIASDAHSTVEFLNLRFGIGQARRGWLEKRDVLNTRRLAELRPLLRRSMRP